jgi:hypothetical protein
VATVVRAKPERLVGARFPFTDGIEFHGDFVARRRLVECEQMTTMSNDIDEGAVLERPL